MSVCCVYVVVCVGYDCGVSMSGEEEIYYGYLVWYFVLVLDLFVCGEIIVEVECFVLICDFFCVCYVIELDNIYCLF